MQCSAIGNMLAYNCETAYKPIDTAYKPMNTAYKPITDAYKQIEAACKTIHGTCNFTDVLLKPHKAKSRQILCTPYPFLRFKFPVKFQ